MSSFLCFICHSTVNADTHEDTREKYKDVVGIHLCPNSHLCYICCHMLNKLWLYKSVCLKRSLEYPVLFSEKGTLNLQRTDLEIHILCPDETCEHYQNHKINFESYHYNYDDIHIQNESQQYVNNKYCQLQEEKEFDDFFQYGNPCPEYNCNFNDDKQTHIQEIVKTCVSNSFDQNSCKSAESYDEVDNKSLLDNNEETDLHTDINNVDNSEAELEKNIKNYEVLETSDISDVIKHTPETEMTTENTTETKSKTKKCKKVAFNKITLSLEEQKAELEALRKEKKYIESEFKCFNCASGFLFKDTYQAHMMRHEESNGEYLCSVCSLRFASPAVLRSHNAAHSLRYRCVQCSENVKPRGRSTHIARCPNDRNTITVGPNLAAACHLCAAMFRTSAGLQQHLKRFHRSKTSGKTYSCNVCGKSYNNQSAVRTHMIKHINRQFQCDQCEATFTSPYTLNQHKKKHAICGQPSDHYCETCDLRYTSRKSLLAHKRNALIHQQTVYDCNICNRICPNQRALATHIETIHATEKKYACWTCGARYGNKKSLLRHIRTHTEKQWKIVATCHLCGGNFKSNSKLNRHLREVCEKAKLEEQLSSLYDQE